MKQVYEAPRFEVETYELDASIASNCAEVINDGPALGGHTACEKCPIIFPMSIDGATIEGLPHNVTFYADSNCDCYTTGNDGTYWTS